MLPAWDGHYVFGQWSTAWDSPLGSLFVASRPEGDMDELWNFETVELANREDGKLNEYLLSFGQDLDGEVYVLTSETTGPSGNTGKVYRIVPPEEDEMTEGEGEADQTMAQELWDDLQAVDYTAAWSLVPGKGELYPGQDPHGVLLTTYLNPEAEEALENQPGEFAEGATLVKENYGPDETLASLTVMQKQPGYDPDHNDWFWAKYSPEGEIQAAGMPGGCISCHGAVRSNDYVFSFPVNPLEVEAMEPTDEMMTMAVELWEDLQDEEYAEAWSLVPGKGELYPGQDPHGVLLTTYLNPEAEDALQNQPGEVPEGGIIVKENYTGEEELASVTVMQKEPGFDPAHDDWFWAKYAPDGTVQAAGMPAGCLSCHGAVRSNDYIFTFPVAPISPTGAPPEVTEDGMEEEEEAMEVPEDAITIEVTARSYEFDPATIEVPVGVPVRFVVESVDIYHTFTVKESEEAEEMLINLDLFPDEGAVETVYTFEESGEYYLYCIPHEAQGMVGSIVVTEE
jgi:plastocyanin